MNITGTEFDDTLEGTELEDVLHGRQGNDTLYGRQGDDELYGNRGDDTLFGNRGDDLLAGGRGHDVLVGGLGADTFSFGFQLETVEGASSSFSGWLAEQGRPALQDGVTTQGQFSSSYSAWLSSLVAEFGLGSDVDGDGEIEVDIAQNSATDAPSIEGVSAEQLADWFGDKESLAVKTGRTTHERWYADEFALPDTSVVTSVTGHDTLQDFSREAGDKLALNGITAADFEAHFEVAEVDAGADGSMDTVITMAGNEDWSITLVGVTGFDASQDVAFA